MGTIVIRPVMITNRVKFMLLSKIKLRHRNPDPKGLQDLWGLNMVYCSTGPSEVNALMAALGSMMLCPFQNSGS